MSGACISTILGALLLMPLPAASQEQAVQKGFAHFYNLEFDEAIQQFQLAVQAAPGEPDPHNHLAQSVLYRAMYRAGALESEMVSGGNAFLRREKVNPTPADQKQFDEAIATAMRLAQARLAAGKDDQQATYSLGVSYGLRANYNFLVRKAWMDALRDATSGRKLHNRLTDLDPSFTDGRMMQGAHDYVVGSLPWHYKFLGFLVGYRGDKEQGIRTLQLVAEKGKRNNVDAGILLAVIYRRERRAKDAIPLLNGLIGRFPRNYLLRLELAQMYSDAGDKTNSFRTLAEVEELKRAGAPGFERLPIEKILYFRANVQFWYNDLDQAIANFQRVTQKAEELDMNTGVLAWMRLGQTYDLKGRREEAVAAYRKAIAYAPESSVARESRSYLNSPYRRKAPA